MGKLVPPVQPGDWKRLRAIFNKLNLLEIANYQSSISANDSEISAVSAQAVSNDSEISVVSTIAQSGISANSSAISVVDTELQSVSSNLVTTDSELQVVSAAEMGHADISTFTGLTDTPANYTGKSGNLVKVVSAENALEFFSPSYASQSATGALSTAVVTNDSGVTAARSGIGANSSAISASGGGGGGTSTFTGLTDTPASYTGEAGKYAKVDAAESGLVFDSTAGGGGGGAGFSTMVRAYAGDWHTMVSSTWTKVQYNTENYDLNSEYDHATNYRFTAKTAGYYVVYAQGKIYVPNTGYVMKFKVYKNGTTDVAITELYNSGNCDYNIISVYTTVYLGINDYIEIYGYNGYSSNINIDKGTEITYLTVHRLK